MAITQVQFIPAPGQAGLAAQAPGLPTGLEGLFAQLIDAAALSAPPLTTADAANIAQTLPPAVSQQLPADPTALADLLNKVQQALQHKDVAALTSILSGAGLTGAEGALQNLPPQATLQAASVATLPDQALPVVRSALVTFQPTELGALIQHEQDLLRQLGHGDIDLTASLANPATPLDTAALTQAYEEAGLTHDEAVVRVGVITQVVDHLAAAPQAPLTLAVPVNVVSAPPLAPLSLRPDIFLQALQAAAQTTPPQGEDLVLQIMALDDKTSTEQTDAHDAAIETLAAAVVANSPAPALSATPVAGVETAASAAAPSATEILARVGLPSSDNIPTTTPGGEVDNSGHHTDEGQLVDVALDGKPAAQLLAATGRANLVNGAAAQSGAAISVTVDDGQNGTDLGDSRSRDLSEVGERGTTGHEASVVSFDRVLGQKLAAQLPVAATYNAQGKIPTPAEQVSISIRQLANNGGGDIRIKLMPEELGRVDLHLEVHRGQVRGVIMVERPEVMQDLARDLKGLQQALVASGLTVADNALSFQMRQQGSDQDQSGHQPRQRGGLTEVATSFDEGLPLPTGRWRDVTKLVDVNI